MLLSSFVQLGKRIKYNLHQPSDAFKALILRAKQENGWFEEPFVLKALEYWATLLQEDNLKIIFPTVPAEKPKKVLVIGAGNIPLAAFHDVLCVLASGHHLILKLSSDDRILITTLLQWLMELEPEWRARISFLDTPLKNHKPDAVIASGSDASEKIFREYFKNIPHILRKSRTGLAVLNGKETDDELKKLADDVFLYFGLGCRNVTALLVPENYDLNRLASLWEKPYAKLLMQNKKYSNNYDYYKALFVLSKTDFSDHGFFLAKNEMNSPFSPPSVINIIPYKNVTDSKEKIQEWVPRLQCVVGANQKTDFGFAQFPVINDFADGINTMEFLVNLN
jgi:hypothetical protein